MPQLTPSDIIGVLVAMLSVVEGCNVDPVVQDPNRFATSFSASAHVIDPGMEVVFIDESQYEGETAVAWDWDFGNGQTASGPGFGVTYGAPGLYDVTLRVTCESGAVFTRAESNLVCVRDPELASGAQPGERIELAGITFVWVPAGSFLQGSAQEIADTDEKPVRPTELTRGFWMSQCEITQAQWESVLFRQPAWFANEGGQNPVEYVSWDDANVFLKYLSDISPGTFRLPTEAEWEYACRAGSQTEWFFGDDSADLPVYAWYAYNAGNTTHAVGLLEPNAWGLYDLAGNVGEWTHDYYAADIYAAGDAIDPLCQTAGRFRVVRGGSWRSPWHQTRSAYRTSYVPSSRYSSIGLRVVCN